LMVGFLVVILSIFLAWLFWRFVETPARRTGASLTFLRVAIVRFVMPVVVLFSVCLVIAYTNGISIRFDSRVVDFEKVIEAKPEVLRSGCHVPTAMYSTPPNNSCRLGIDKTGIDGILVGDSFANHFSGLVDVMAKAEGRAFMDYTMDGCPPIFGYDTGKGSAYAGRCIKRNQTIFDLIAKSQYSHVILAGSWPRDKKTGEQLAVSIDKVLKSGSKLTVILANEGIEKASSCPVRSLMFGNSGRCERAKIGPPEYFVELELRFPSVHFIDPNRIICRDSLCNPVLDDIPVYRDDAHLNDIGSRLIGSYLIKMGESI